MSQALQPIEATSPVPADEERNRDPFMIEPPSNRGKFSQVRDTWDRIHQQRYVQWQLGDSIETIAAEYGVTYNAIKHSIQYCEGRMPQAQVLTGRSMRLRLRTIAALADQYVTELGKLMSDENPFVRLKALEHFRRTLGIDSGGVQIRTEFSVHTNVENGFSYEERLALIRAEQEKAALGDQHLEPRLLEKRADGTAKTAVNRNGS